MVEIDGDDNDGDIYASRKRSPSEDANNRKGKEK